jgi:hypothetical protein
VALLALLLLAGCSQRSVPLAPEWRPLERVVESSFVQPHMFTTVAPVMYAHDLDEFTGAEPTWRDAILTHERVHAVRQLEQGPGFYRDYAAFPSVRWVEEKLAWSAEIAFLKAHGVRPDPFAYAELASKNYFGMVDYDVALAWFAAEVGK